MNVSYRAGDHGQGRTVVLSDPAVRMVELRGHGPTDKEALESLTLALCEKFIAFADGARASMGGDTARLIEERAQLAYSNAVARRVVGWLIGLVNVRSRQLDEILRTAKKWRHTASPELLAIINRTSHARGIE
jgi:hypothetical protein